MEALLKLLPFAVDALDIAAEAMDTLRDLLAAQGMVPEEFDAAVARARRARALVIEEQEAAEREVFTSQR